MNELAPAFPATPPDPIRLIKAKVDRRLLIPLLQSFIQAGFPSPAENYIEKVCDLNEMCIHNAEATYFAKVAGDSMTGDRIEPGDLLIVDCSDEPRHGRISVVWLNGEYTVKRLLIEGGLIFLVPSNPRYAIIPVVDGDDFRFFGEVTYVIQKPL